MKAPISKSHMAHGDGTAGRQRARCLIGRCLVVLPMLYIVHAHQLSSADFLLGRRFKGSAADRSRTFRRAENSPSDDAQATRELLDRSFNLEPQINSGQVDAKVTNSQIKAGQVLIADPRRFAAAACRAGAGSVGLLPDLADWVLRVSAFLGIGGLDLVADIDRWKRANWMPVVLLTEVSDGAAVGVSLTARTGILLGDVQEEGALSFASRPLHWGGPERSPLMLLHPYAGVPGSRELGDSGLFVSKSLRQAREWLDENAGSSLRFRFFSNRVQWGAGELERELQNGVWFPISASRDLVLDESQSVGADPLWSVIASLVGGEVEDLGKSYDLFSR